MPYPTLGAAQFVGGGVLTPSELSAQHGKVGISMDHPVRTRSRAVLSLAVVTAVFIFVDRSTGFAGDAEPSQAAFDSPEVRPASDVVPPALLRGPHYHLGPTVATFTFMNQYSVTSDYGSFGPPSDVRLRRLVREIAAIAALKNIHESDAFAKATVEAGKGVVQGAQNLINDPVSTINALPEAVFSVFGRVSEATKRSGRSQYEDGVAQNLLAVSSFKREYAQKLDVDVYSTNEVLQKELNSVAWAAAAGNLTLSAASMVTGAAVLQAASGLRTLDQAKNIVNALPATELARRNREALRQMGVPNVVTDRFLQNHVLSPRHETVIVEAMKHCGAYRDAQLLSNMPPEPTARTPLSCSSRWRNSSPDIIGRSPQSGASTST